MCPEKEFNIFKYKEPWMNRDLMGLIIDKDKALWVAKKSNIEEDWKYAKYMRNNVGKLIEEAKKNYLNDEFLTTKRDPKKFWRNINSILPNNKKNDKSKIFLKSDNGKDIEENETSNYINNFFSNIGPNVAKHYNKEWEYFGMESDFDIEDIAINKFEVLDLIKNIDISKSSGIDKLS